MSWPTWGLALSTVLVNDRSACCTITLTELWSSSPATLLLGFESGSGWSTAVTWARLVIVPFPVTRAAICRLALLPLLTTPTLQRPVVLLYAPCEGDEPRNVSPLGNRSVTEMFVAAPGPSFRRFSVKLTVPSGFGAALSTVFVSDRSARCGVSVMLL